ncbi:MAG: hypothetical protein GKR89_03495 [Candidatus Latescibacteria bacterium]|nr:hypothetical protein [Candidatus Latescibacterota bacterium]
MDKPVFVCAHRGASRDFPENTIPAYQEAVALGCGMIEFDVRATADGVPMILHDPTVDRTTDGSGSIWDLQSAAAKELDARAGHDAFAGVRIPTLEETLDFMPANIELNIHVYPGPADAAYLVETVCREIKSRNLYANAFIAGSDEVMQLVIDGDPNVRRCLLGSQNRADEYARLAHQMGCTNSQPLNSITTREFCDQAHALGLTVHPFYADDEAEMRRLIDCGVDGILTNRPRLMVELLDKLGSDGH